MTPGDRVFTAALAADGTPANVTGTVESYDPIGRMAEVLGDDGVRYQSPRGRTFVLRVPDDIAATITFLVGKLQQQRDAARAESAFEREVIGAMSAAMLDLGIDSDRVWDAATLLVSPPKLPAEAPWDDEAGGFFGSTESAATLPDRKP